MFPDGGVMGAVQTGKKPESEVDIATVAIHPTAEESRWDGREGWRSQEYVLPRSPEADLTDLDRCQHADDIKYPPQPPLHLTKLKGQYNTHQEMKHPDQTEYQTASYKGNGHHCSSFTGSTPRMPGGRILPKSSLGGSTSQLRCTACSKGNIWAAEEGDLPAHPRRKGTLEGAV